MIEPNKLLFFPFQAFTDECNLTQPYLVHS